MAGTRAWAAPIRNWTLSVMATAGLLAGCAGNGATPGIETDEPSDEWQSIQPSLAILSDNMPGFEGHPGNFKRRTSHRYFVETGRWKRDSSEFPQADVTLIRYTRQGYFFSDHDEVVAPSRIKEVFKADAKAVDCEGTAGQRVQKIEHCRVTMSGDVPCLYFRVYSSRAVGGRYEDFRGGNLLGSDRREGIYCNPPGRAIDQVLTDAILRTMAHRFGQ